MKESDHSGRKPSGLDENWKLIHQPHAWLEEHDACAIVAAIRKTGEPTHGNLKRAMEALSKMGHRSGVVNGEGDGCGVLTDIPRRLWASALEEQGKPAWLAEDRRFFVGHLMIPNEQLDQWEQLQEQVLGLVKTHGASILLRREGQVGHGARAVSRSVGLAADTLAFLARYTGLELLSVFRALARLRAGDAPRPLWVVRA